MHHSSHSLRPAPYYDETLQSSAKAYEKEVAHMSGRNRIRGKRAKLLTNANISARDWAGHK